MKKHIILFSYFAVLVLVVSLLASQSLANVYVTNTDTDNVSVIDTTTNTVTATIAVGDWPFGIAVNPAGTRVYVANFNTDNVSVIDTASNSVIATIAVGDAPYGIAVNPAGARVYVTNWNDDTVSVIDTTTNSVIATIAVGDGPYGIAVNPAGIRVYVTNCVDDTVSVIDATSNTVLSIVIVGNSPAYIVWVTESAPEPEPEESNGCFIATAAYGSSMEPHVVVLREFRDRFLRTNTFGTSFLKLYYTYSPPLARFIRNHDSMRAFVRFSLLPTLAVSWATLNRGPIATFALMLFFVIALGGLAGFRRKGRR